MSGTSSIIYQNASLVSDGNMTASINSSAFDLQLFNNYSIQAIFTGSPNGSLKLQISNDIADSPTNWSDYTGSSTTVTTSGDFVWKVSSAGERYVRVVYTFSSGSGTLNVSISAKG